MRLADPAVRFTSVEITAPRVIASRSFEEAMTPISQMSVGELVSSIRDLAFVGTLLIAGWKSRSWVQPLVDFFKRANTFMDHMETGMTLLLNNHLQHMQADLKHLAGRQEQIVATEVVEEPNSAGEV